MWQFLSLKLAPSLIPSASPGLRGTSSLGRCSSAIAAARARLPFSASWLSGR